MDLGLTSIMIEDLKLQSRELLLLFNYCSGLIGFFPPQWNDVILRELVLYVENFET